MNGVMENKFSTAVGEYLRNCGVSKGKISECHSDTRLYHDLGIYGDVAEACVEVLIRDYGVDMSGFDFDEFFPQEFSGENSFTRVVGWVLPFVAQKIRSGREYSPLTLEMIDHLMRVKRWDFKV